MPYFQARGHITHCHPMTPNYIVRAHEAPYGVMHPGHVCGVMRVTAEVGTQVI